MPNRPDDIRPGKNIDLGQFDGSMEAARWKSLLHRSAEITYNLRPWILTEALVCDQWNNLVIVYLCRLKDLETWEWKAWLPPTKFKEHGGSYHPDYPHRGMTFPDSLFKEMRIAAIKAFINSENKINQSINVIQSNIPEDILEKLNTRKTAPGSPHDPATEASKGNSLFDEAGNSTIPHVHPISDKTEKASYGVEVRNSTNASDEGQSNVSGVKEEHGGKDGGGDTKGVSEAKE